MRFKSINKIEYAGDYGIVNNKCYFIKDNAIFQEPNTIITPIGDFWGAHFREKLIHIFTNRSQNIFYDYNGNTIGVLDNANIYFIFNEHEVIWYNRDLKATLYNDKVLIQGKLRKYIIYEGIIYFNSENLIKCLEYNISNNNLLWERSIASVSENYSLNFNNLEYEVKHFIGIYEKKLIVQLNDATFLFLNVDNGELVHIIQLDQEFPLPQGVFYNDNHAAHLFENKLIWLSNQRLLEIDLDTFNVHVIKDYFHESRENQFRFMSNSFHNGSVYFVADIGWQYVTPSHVGVMNPNTGEILWSQQLENTGGLAEAPQATEDKLYIRTNKGVLHIFEKENL